MAAGDDLGRRADLGGDLVVGDLAGGGGVEVDELRTGLAADLLPGDEVGVVLHDGDDNLVSGLEEVDELRTGLAADLLPGDEVGVVLHDGDDNLVSGLEHVRGKALCHDVQGFARVAAEADDVGADGVVGRAQRGVLELCGTEQGLGLLRGEAAACRVDELIGTHVAEGCSVVARDVVLIAQDVRDGFVVHALARQQHSLALVALGALGPMDEYAPVSRQTCCQGMRL